MNPVVVFHHLAAREYRQARAWYRRRSPAAAERFRDEVDRAVQRISEAPLEGAIFRETIRWRLIKTMYKMRAFLRPTRERKATMV